MATTNRESVDLASRSTPIKGHISYDFSGIRRQMRGDGVDDEAWVSLSCQSVSVRGKVGLVTCWPCDTRPFAIVASDFCVYILFLKSHSVQ